LLSLQIKSSIGSTSHWLRLSEGWLTRASTSWPRQATTPRALPHHLALICRRLSVVSGQWLLLSLLWGRIGNTRPHRVDLLSPTSPIILISLNPHRPASTSPRLA